jgi:hypothetical protein
MAVIVASQISLAGVNENLVAAAAGGDSFLNDGRVFFNVKNAHATLPRTITFASQLSAGAVPAGSAKADKAVVVAALTEKRIGPFEPTSFNDANGRVVVTYSDAAADLTVEAVRL